MAASTRPSVIAALYGNTTGSEYSHRWRWRCITDITGNNNTAFGVDALLAAPVQVTSIWASKRARKLTRAMAMFVSVTVILGVAGESNTTRIRNVYSCASGRAVYVNADNKIGTLASPPRSKTTSSRSIRPVKPSRAQPVSFRYKKEIEAYGTMQFGFIAEEVADINPDLVTRNSEGKPKRCATKR